MALLRGYLALLYLLSRYIGFASIPVVHIAFTGLLTLASGYEYAQVIALNVPDEATFLLLYGFFATVILHCYLYGFFSRIGLPSPLPFVRYINSMYSGVMLRESEEVRDYTLLLRLMTRFSRWHIYAGFMDIAIVMAPVMVYDNLYDNSRNAMYYGLAAFLGMSIHTQFCYVTSDLSLGRFRSILKRKIHLLGSIPPNDYSLSLKWKFLFVGVLILQGAFTLITIMQSSAARDPEHIWRIIGYAAFSILLLVFLAAMYFSSIFVAIDELKQASLNLSEGRDPNLYTRSSDYEIAILAEGFFHAAQKVINYQKDLESRINEATLELVSANNELRQKEYIIEKELDFAADVQKSIIPQKPKNWNGIRFYGSYRPMRKVSGDYFDIFRTPSAVYAVMADVSGHGVPAALITMTVKSAFANAINYFSDPVDIFRSVNDDLCNRIQTQDYLTAFLVKIDEHNQVTFCNASHPRMIHLTTKRTIRFHDCDGLFIGVMPEASESYRSGKTTLKSGERLLLYTDGVVEVKNSDGEEFGEERLAEIFRETADLPLDKAHQQMELRLLRYTGGSSVRDDITLLSIELDPRWNRFMELFNSGSRMMRRNIPQEAETALLEAQKMIPNYPRLKFYLARLYVQQKKFVQAAHLLDEFLAIFPQDPRALQLLGECKIASGDAKAAADVIARLKAIEPVSERSRRLSLKLRDLEKREGLDNQDN